MMRDDVVAIALLTDSDVARLGGALRAVYRIDNEAAFTDLLAAIDRADTDLHVRVDQAARR